MELLASGIWKCRSPHSPPWSVDREGGAANYPHLQVPRPNFHKSRFLLPLLNASLTSNCSSALPRGLIMRGEVHFLDHCSLAETSGTFLKEATYFYLQLTPQQSVSKLSLRSFVFICKMSCDFWPGALTTRWAHSDYSLPFPAPANYRWSQQVLGWWTFGILHSFYCSFSSFSSYCHILFIFLEY